MVPAISEQALATTREASPKGLPTASDVAVRTELAIREVDQLSLPEQPVEQPVPAPIAPAPPPAPRVLQTSTGKASWYGPGFYGNRTANGEVFRPGTMTAAHRTLPFGTRVRVTNLNNGRTAVVRINDRGPFHGSRVIDLAHGAATQLGVVSSGLARVKLEVLQ
ncbi:septal ring lytic transglycosylase RlpA family protein [Synechococcus sp. GFB01]|uniref:septal ring lytic transglycosylase RlpA family protein n=1 Tax=Synechococcus sp. GFB01 TaxID=1662190 RepID=UPI00350E982D